MDEEGTIGPISHLGQHLELDKIKQKFAID